MTITSKIGLMTGNAHLLPIDRNDPTLALYLPMWYPHGDMTGSTIYSYDKNRHSCTVTGMTWQYDGRLSINAGDTIDCGTPDVLKGTTDTTVCVWFKPRVTGTEDCLVSKNNVNLQDRYRFVVDANNAIRLWKESQDDGGVTLTGSAVAIGSWSFLVTQFGSIGMQLFINGANDTSNGTTTVLTAGTHSSLFIGEDYNTYSPPDGVLGDVLIYTHALSAGEIMRLYQATKWRYV